MSHIPQLYFFLTLALGIAVCFLPFIVKLREDTNEPSNIPKSSYERLKQTLQRLIEKTSREERKWKLNNIVIPICIFSIVAFIVAMMFVFQLNKDFWGQIIGALTVTGISALNITSMISGNEHKEKTEKLSTFKSRLGGWFENTNQSPSCLEHSAQVVEDTINHLS